MPIEAGPAYELFKTSVGGSLETPIFASKRARMLNYDNVPAEVQAIWATTVGTARADGTALWLAFKTLMDAETWTKSVPSNDEAPTLPLIAFVDLSTKIQDALDLVAIETAV